MSSPTLTSAQTPVHTGLHTSCGAPRADKRAGLRAYTVMAYVVMAYAVMADAVMAYVVTAYVVVAYVGCGPM